MYRSPRIQFQCSACQLLQILIGGAATALIQSALVAREKNFGVHSNAMPEVTPTSGGNAQNQSRYAVLLIDVGANKVAVINAIRGTTTLSVLEAKSLAETPLAIIKTDLSLEEATAVTRSLNEAGAYFYVI